MSNAEVFCTEKIKNESSALRYYDYDIIHLNKISFDVDCSSEIYF